MNMFSKLRESVTRESNLESEILATTASSNVFQNRRAVSHLQRQHSESEDFFSSHSSDIFCDSPMRLDEIEENKQNFQDLKAKIRDELKELRDLVERLDSSESSFDSKACSNNAKHSASQRRTQSNLAKLALFEEELRHKKEQEEFYVEKLIAAKVEHNQMINKIQSIEELRIKSQNGKACCECTLI